MNRITLYHHSRHAQYRSPFGAAPCGTGVTLSLDVTGLPADCVCTLRIWFRDIGETLIPMAADHEEVRTPPAHSEPDVVWRRYTAVYDTPNAPGLAWYYFIVHSSGITRYYGNNDRGSGGEGKEVFSPPPSYQLTIFEENFVPDWWKEGTVYQIFVDRFHRGADWQRRFFNSLGTEERRGPTRILQSEWRDPPFLYKDDRGWVTRWPFYGGTLEGIQEKLPYLRSLGVTVLYLNPIFEAASNHKYDTGDYMKVDPGFGDEESFKALAEAAEASGISLILDGVFSHTGADSIYFNKYGNYPSLGAWQSKDSPYRDWYRFNSDPEGYECWWGVADLPNVEENNESYQAYIWGDEDSVIRHWIRAGARGWRLDVADEIPDEFIRNIKAALRETKPDGLLLGEVWEDASNKRSYGVQREYFFGRELDSTMNYPFRDWGLDFALGHIPPAELHERIMTLYENYPRENFFSCLNLVGSHDRKRALTVLGEAPDEAGLSEWQKQSWRLNGAQRDLAKRRLKLLSLWQMCFPGVPSVFYGDEAGMEGFSDPYNRGPFPWGYEDEDLVNWYRLIGNLRLEYEVLRNGDFTSHDGGKRVYAFSRAGGKERILVFLNGSRDAGEDVCIALSENETVFVDLLSGSAMDPEPADDCKNRTDVLWIEAPKAGQDAGQTGAGTGQSGIGAGIGQAGTGIGTGAGTRIGTGTGAEQDGAGAGQDGAGAGQGGAGIGQAGGFGGAGAANGAPEAAGRADADGDKPGRALCFHVGGLEFRAIYIRAADPALLAMKNLPRAAGILCHVTSLPSDSGCGDFGQAAYDFCDYLSSAGQKIWQILPLTTTDDENSPYAGGSAFAGNELLLDCAALVKDGLLTAADLAGAGAGNTSVIASEAKQPSAYGTSGADANRADFARAGLLRRPLFEKAFLAFDGNDKDFQAFCAENEDWLPDYCLYRAVTEEQDGKAWQDWPEDIRNRKEAALAAYGERLSRPVAFHRFLQYQFSRQWNALKGYAAKQGVSILGDMPIYLSAGSCDTWVHRELFRLDAEGHPDKTGGVPPDAFSEDGQNWNTPVFNWEAHRAQGYAWWIRRFRRNLHFYDFLRLDHFRGFDACWEIPAGETTAKRGDWVKSPGKALFEAAEAALGPLPLLAEDLGYITSNVHDLKNTFAWPGMKVYQFHADSMRLGDITQAREAAQAWEAARSGGADGGSAGDVG
ncbi:MAG: 4-alpha-glucanotransferase, partial [Clostridiales Family XIII bacterium]|nr:4-alpha-glucanotransferase [Clostridiales Family XIII bacterium]